MNPDEYHQNNFGFSRKKCTKNYMGHLGPENKYNTDRVLTKRGFTDETFGLAAVFVISY